MDTTRKLKIAITATAVVLSCGVANAQHWRWHHSHPYHVLTVVPKPAVTVHVSNRFTQKERFRMAATYLKSHSYLTIKKYARMTKLPQAAAEAELDAFAADKNKPVTAVIKGKKKVYVWRKKDGNLCVKQY